MADPQAIVDAVKAGDYDGELGLLLNALMARAALTETAFGWRIRLSETDEFDMESVTLQELATAERALSTPGNQASYLELDPLRSADHLVALVVAHYHHVGGMTIPDAFVEARKLTVTDLKDIVSTYEVRPPKDDGGTSPS
jgi:hypothetical protein